MFANSNANIEMSVEELALSLGLMGKPDTAKILLKAAFGEISSEEEKGRLLAASHSLVSRELVSVQDNQARLSSVVQEIVTMLVDCDFLIRFDLTKITSEETLSYYVRGETVLEQRINQGVAYRFSCSSGIAGIVHGGKSFFALADKTDIDCPDLVIPISIMEKARETSRSATEVAELFASSGVPNFVAILLTEDLREPLCRGSAMRIEGIDKQLMSNEGLLFLMGKRQWLFPLVFKDEGPYVRIVPGTAMSFERQVRKMLRRV
jgi:hypothetical protein